MAATDLEDQIAELANDSGPLDPDVELTLQDALADPDETVSDDQPIPLGRTPAIDFVQRRMIPNTSGGPLMLYGEDALAQWIEKCLRTRRGDNAACHPDFGVDALLFDLVDGGTLDDSAVAQYQAIVERALSVHPAIESVAEFHIDYDLDDDAATTYMRIVRVSGAGDPVNVTVALDGGA
jgi:phage baseplate assembly protein W